ncbi:MAG: lycopene beta-cyclase CrtY [Planctomycetota bacterium]
MMQQPPTNEAWDYCLVGGGLQASLLVLALRHHQPKARVLVLERRAQPSSSLALAGQTWSCQASDIPDDCRVWLSPLFLTTWPAYNVRFPKFQRRINIGYCSLRSWDLANTLQQVLASGGNNLQWRWGQEAARIESGHVELESGEAVAARCAIDCRGQENHPPPTETGYQKFFGWEVELDSPWSLDVPTVMDVDGAQDDGFRFIYVLPFNRQRLLLQDTRFSDSAEVDPTEAASRLRAYLAQHGHANYKVVRQEHGLLPMPFASFSPEPREPVLRAGYRGGWFHAATGYSLPLAIQYAAAVARVPPDQAREVVSRLARKHRFRFRYARFLNRLLFRLLPPTSRTQVFYNFYRWLPESVIGRFYAHTFSRLDAIRLFLGRPPCPLSLGRFVKSFRSC